MSWNTTPTATQALVEQGILTAKEAEALELKLGGMSPRAIAIALRISRGAVRDRLKNATRKINEHQENHADPAPTTRP